MRIKTQEKVRAYLAYGLGSVFVLALVMPLIWVVTTSVRPLSEMTQTPPLVFPSSVTFSAYVDTRRDYPWAVWEVLCQQHGDFPFDGPDCPRV